MEQTCHDTDEHDAELIEVLSEISRVSARMARDLTILAACRRAKGSTAEPKAENGK